MCIGFLRKIVIVLIGFFTFKVQGLSKTLDLESSVCDSRHTVSDNDLYYIIANPRNDRPSGRDHCNIFFTADPPIRKFYIYIRKLQISDCGVSLKVYDGDPYLKNHKWSLSCKGPPAWKLATDYGSIALRLEKYTSESSDNYIIDIVLTTDQGPFVDTGTSGGNMDGGLSTGAIIGIAVGAGLAVAVIVGFVLFCACRMFKDKDDKHPPSTVFSTAPPRLAHGFLKPDSSRASSSVHRVEFLGVGANEGRLVSSRYSTAGSYRTKSSKSSQSYENSAYTRSEDGSSFDAIDGKVTSSPGVRKKTTQADSVSGTRSSYRKKNGQIESNQNANQSRSEKYENQNDQTRTSRTNNKEKHHKDDEYKEKHHKDDEYKEKHHKDDEYKEKHHKDDEYKQRKPSEQNIKRADERPRSDSKSRSSRDQRDRSSDRIDRHREQRNGNTKSRLYEPDQRYYSDSEDRDRKRINRRTSSRSHDSKHRSRYDRENNSSSSHESSDYRHDTQRSTSRRRCRDDEDRYKDHTVDRRKEQYSSRDRSHSTSRSVKERDRDRNSDRPQRSRSRSETRSRSKADYDDRYDHDRHRRPENLERHHRHDTHRSHSESRNRDQRSRTRSQRDSYIRPSR